MTSSEAMRARLKLRFTPTLGMIDLVRAARRGPVQDAADLHACRRRGLIASDGLATDAGLQLLVAYGAEAPRRG